MAAKNLTLTSSRNWRNRDDDWDYQQIRPLSVPRPLNNQQGEGDSMHLPWRRFEERVRTGPFGLARFPTQPHCPAQILIIEGAINGERVNPRLLQFIQESPPRIRGEWQLGLLPDSEPPALTDDEFNAAMKKLRKQTYYPPQPKRNSWKRRGLFSNRNNSSSSNNNNKDVYEIKIEKKEEDKQCAICLESFVPKEQVLMTPCNHMFHNKCVVPWVRSHGRCPVCRFKLIERKETVQAQNYRNYSNNNANIYEDDLALDLITLLRAMEEAFMWMHLS